MHKPTLSLQTYTQSDRTQLVNQIKTLSLPLFALLSAVAREEEEKKPKSQGDSGTKENELAFPFFVSLRPPKRTRFVIGFEFR